MWRTPAGERTLVGAEARLVRELVGYVYDQIDVIHADPDAPYRVGVGPFDDLQGPQQLALLYEIGAALLSADIATPSLTALKEAAVAVLFRELRIGVEVEIDCEHDQHGSYASWREMILAVFLEDGEDPLELPEAACHDLNEWDCLIASTAERILWDSDWEMEELFVDDDPDRSSCLKQVMRISDDYYLDVAPDPIGSALESVRHNLNELTGAAH